MNVGNARDVRDLRDAKDVGIHQRERVAADHQHERRCMTRNGFLHQEAQEAIMGILRALYYYIVDVISWPSWAA